MNVHAFRDKLVTTLSACPAIKGVGQTGDLNAPLIPGKSDIDLFVLCDAVPAQDERRALYQALADDTESLRMQVCDCRDWGVGDVLVCGGVEIMPMYFTTQHMQRDLDELLSGGRIEKEGGFYPIGRLATIETMNVLCETDRAWSRLIDRVRQHPRPLFRAWYASQAGCMLDDEDLGRCQLRREVLFTHQVVEQFLDRFLQALYAVNDCYFPSRKRTERAIEGFARKPTDCYARLLSLVSLAANEATIDDAVQEIRALASELTALGAQVFQEP